MAANGIRTLPLLNRKSTAALAPSPYVAVEMPRWFARSFVVVTIEAVTGSPTAMSITPSFEAWHSVAGDSEFERTIGSTFTPPWFDINAASNPSVFPDGDFAAFTNVAPPANGNSAMKTILGGFPWRLKLAWTFTGGSAPAAQISAMAYCSEDTVPTAAKPAPGF